MSETFNRITGKPTVKPVAGKVVRSGQVQASSTPPAAVPTGQTATTAPQAAVSQQQSQAGGATAKPTLTNATAGIDVKQQGVAQSQPSNIVASSPDDGGKKFVSMAELMERTSPYKPPTPEELEKERKRQKRQSMWAAIGDGVSALANLYFTSKGAPNSYNPQTSMSAKLKEQFDKIDAERKANTARYQEAYMRAKQYDNMNEQNEREYRRKVFSDMRQAKKDATMLEMKARELEMKGELNEAQKIREQAEIKRIEEQTGKITKEAKWVDVLNNAKVGNLNASTNAHNANAKKSHVDAENTRLDIQDKKSGNGKGEKAYGTFNGKAYANAQDYNKAVIKEARRLGIPLTYGGGTNTSGEPIKPSLRTIAGLAAEVEARTQPATPKGNVTKPVTRKPADKKYQHTRSLGL